jgi:hypothetical protein
VNLVLPPRKKENEKETKQQENDISSAINNSKRIKTSL